MGPRERRLDGTGPFAGCVRPCGSRPVKVLWYLAVPTFKGSGEITSLSQADGYVEIPVEVARLDAGADVEVVGYE